MPVSVGPAIIMHSPPFSRRASQNLILLVIFSELPLNNITLKAGS